MEQALSADRRVAVHQTRCVSVRNRHASCGICLAACPTGAISCADNVVSVDALACVGCGACSTVCPTGVFEQLSCTDDDLYRRCAAALKASGGTSVTLACENAEMPPEQVCARIPCLARVDEGLLATLAALGATEVELACGSCGQCEKKVGAKVCSEMARRVAELFGALGVQVEVRVASRVALPAGVLEDVDPSELADSREDPCQSRAAGQGGKSSPEKPARLAKVNPYKGTLPQHLPEGRRRLLKAAAVLRRRGHDDGDARLLGAWGSVTIDPLSCTSCRACTIFCPTGALRRFSEDDGSVGIEHVSGLCVGCGACEAACRAGALRLEREAGLAEVLAGRARRFAVRPPAHPNGEPDSMLWRIRELTGFKDLALQGIVTGHE